MNPTTALLAFANLLETAHLCAMGKPYEKQEELIAQCREERRAFLASMPVRHRFRCAICGIETAEVELHFEDPKQELFAPPESFMWGTPVGRFFDIDLSSLHGMLSHAQALPVEFVALLENAKP